MNLDIEIKNIRNIKEANLSFPLDKGIYTLVGENGCGKSTLMLIMSLIVKTSSSYMLNTNDICKDSKIHIETESGEDDWYYKNGKMTTGKFTKLKGKKYANKPHVSLVVSTHWPGFYEGSIFYGCRFDDFDTIDKFVAMQNYQEELVMADQFVAETLGYILHNNKSHYTGLMKIRNRKTAEKYGFKGIPYFSNYNGKLVSQFRMSSGESMLISLVDFINNLVIKNKNKKQDKFLFLIDEVELALHPGAIDRLIQFLSDLLLKTPANLVIYFSTHSAELIHRIDARKIFLVENTDGYINIINPCYPNYAIRNLYIPNGFDFLLLVEDELSKAIVEHVLMENNLRNSKLCCVLPAGGCTQMLKLHNDILTYNALGIGKKIISIYDGDVQNSINQKEEYKKLPKCFLPIPSVEKYLKNKLVDNIDKKFLKIIGDKYFIKRSLNDIIADYKNDDRTRAGKDNDGKNFYKIVISNLNEIGMSEDIFIKNFAKDIYEYEKPVRFVNTLKSLLS